MVGPCIHSQVIMVWRTVWLTSLLAGFDGILQAVHKPCDAQGPSNRIGSQTAELAKGCLVFFGLQFNNSLCDFNWFYVCILLATDPNLASWSIVPLIIVGLRGVFLPVPTESAPRCSHTGCSCSWSCYGTVQRIAPGESRHSSLRRSGNHNKLQQCTWRLPQRMRQLAEGRPFDITWQTTLDIYISRQV